jgi:hydroxymethylglutaryl-CoA lyase
MMNENRDAMHSPSETPAPPAAQTVLISEVGPRDGLQSVQAVMPTAHKLAWIDALHASGLREVEVGSFVPTRTLPQMADVADVVRHATALPAAASSASGSRTSGPPGAAGCHRRTRHSSVRPERHGRHSRVRRPSDISVCP